MADKPSYDELLQKTKKLENENLRLRKADQARKENEELYRIISENVVVFAKFIKS